MPNKITRRTFQSAGAAALALAATRSKPARASRIVGANDRVRMGFIGVGNRGSQLLTAFLTHDDCEVAAVCDVFDPYVERAKARLDGKPRGYRDFREVLDRDDLDAVAIATPDHWHAIQTIQACKSGKDVYVEKPLCVTIHEGRRMVEAARKYERVVQVGTHRRSSPLYAQLAELVQGGKVGKVTLSRAYRLSNMYPNGIGKCDPSTPPKELDWNMWLGPRPERPYQDNIAPYKFRWWHLYSSQMGNWGVHYLDAIRWVTGELAPAAVSALGGRFAVDDDRTVPDTLEVTFQFDSGRLAVFGQYEASGNPAMREGEIELRGTQGTIYVDTRRFNIIPERGGQFENSAPRMEPMEAEAGDNNADLTALHARNFLDCIRSRNKPHADVEIGHRSTSMSLMANISLAVEARLAWDAQQERFTNNEAANQLLHYEYRKPWSLE